MRRVLALLALLALTLLALFVGTVFLQLGLEHWSGNPSTCMLRRHVGTRGWQWCERRGSQVSGRAKEAGEVHDMFSYLWGVGNCEGGEEGWRGEAVVCVRREGEGG